MEPNQPPYHLIQVLDERLRNHDLRRVSVSTDRNCFFQAVSRQLEIRNPYAWISHSELRRKCVDFLRETNSIGRKRGELWRAFLHDESAEAYLSRMSEDGVWADHLMVQAAASVLHCVITIITTAEDKENSVLLIHPKIAQPSNQTIVLSHVTEHHYFSAEEDELAPAGVSIKGKDILSVKDGQVHLGKVVVAKTKTDGELIRSAMKSTTRRPAGRTLHPKFDEDEDAFKAREDPTEMQRGSLSEGSQYSDTDGTFENVFGRKSGEETFATMAGTSTKERDVESEMASLFQEFKKPKDPEWDQFKIIPPEDIRNEHSAVFRYATVLAKYIITFFFFGAVIVGSLASKGSLFVLTNAYSQSYTRSTQCPEYKGKHYFVKYNVMLILMACLCFPDLLSFCYCLYRIIMKKEKEMNWGTCFWGMVPEILHAVGLTFLVLKVVPHVDATLSILMFSLIGVVPAAIHLHAKHKALNSRSPADRARKTRDYAFSIIALIVQPVGIALVCWQLHVSTKPSFDTYIYIAVSLIFVSSRYWENFVSCDFQFFGLFQIKVHERQKELDRVRFKSGIIYSFVRMCFIVGICFLIYFIIDGNESIVDETGSGKPRSMKDYKPRPRCTELITSFWFTAITHCLCGLGVFFCGRVACQTLTQVQGYSFPLITVTPLMSLATALYAVYGASHGLSLPDYFNLPVNKHVAPYIKWTTVATTTSPNWEVAVTIVVGLLVGWLSLIFLTFYLWFPKQEKLARTEVLFVKPIYGGTLINEELMLNRRQYLKDFEKRRKIDQESEKKKKRETLRNRGSKRMSRRLSIKTNRNFTPQVFLCATMWHETEQEMTQLLTSIMRLDRDQGQRRSRGKSDPDMYNFQVHVMFDDAMELTADGPKPNKFVNELVGLIPVAASKVDLGNEDKISPPVVYPTPYGGRLEFVLPCGNMFHVHLKDKQKIRHRKRWSQCMYMYYILGFLQKEKKTYKPSDVFILALDGDVDFQPRALLLLLDRMKRNPDVGAACGRIHPIGSGPVVWFQKFEYAVGHWLQKTAEHVLGCVLCSPGCFSLFRGEALMDANVVKMYTTKATEARHYIQWDQGEDRWLCTLLLKQGWRIEYSAASDSYTFAPEEFKEFYNQRRRWGPSTMANVFDILQDAAITVKNNEYISWGYIAYQMALMGSSILGLATVILVVQGGLQFVLDMDALASLMVALVPVVVFVILCYTTKADFQLAVAGILTVIYALIMMTVLIGIIGQITQSILNPSSLFTVLLVVLYAFTGIIHPTEMLCLLHGFLYYLLVPSAFIFLMIYSLCNMNNVSWGTREVRPLVVAEQQKAALEQVKGKDGKKLRGISAMFETRETEGYGCRLGNFCKIAFCLKHQSTPLPQEYQRIPTEDPTHKRKSMMHRPVTGVDKTEMIRKYSIAKTNFMGQPEGDPRAIRNSLSQGASVNQLRAWKERGGHIDDVAALRHTVKWRRTTLKKEVQSREMAKQLARELEEDRKKVAPLNAPTGLGDDSDAEELDDERLMDEKKDGLYWILDGPMQDGLVSFLDTNEYVFWKDMIDKYLLPLDEDKTDQARIKADLKALRNKMTGAYFFINSLWIVLTFSLNQVIEDVSISIGGENIQPLSFIFLVFFLVILVIQFSTMLVHRWSTFVHLMAATSFNWKEDRYNAQAWKPVERQAQEENPRQKKFRNRAKKRVKTTVDDAESGVAHDNAAFEDSNFSYKAPSTSQLDGMSEVFNASDASDLDEPHVTEYVPGSSLRWKSDSQGLVATLAEASRSSRIGDPTSRMDAPEISPQGNSSRDSLDYSEILFSDRHRMSHLSSGNGMTASNSVYQEGEMVTSDEDYNSTSF